MTLRSDRRVMTICLAGSDARAILGLPVMPRLSQCLAVGKRDAILHIKAFECIRRGFRLAGPNGRSEKFGANLAGSFACDVTLIGERCSKSAIYE